ncbi:UDP-glucose 4-epimerase [Burkholderia latens]|uniref:hypothetical protein n=1 Tax=Burkholderia latens TaxID=488446 RepID=UPI0039A7056C
MTVSGELHEGDWSVAIETVAAESGGIHVALKSPEGMCERTFAHCRTHATEREAAIDALRAGMTWIEMKKSNTFTI